MLKSHENKICSVSYVTHGKMTVIKTKSDNDNGKNTVIQVARQHHL